MLKPPNVELTMISQFLRLPGSWSADEEGLVARFETTVGGVDKHETSRRILAGHKQG